MPMVSELVPLFHTLTRPNKERLLGQRTKVIWLFGLSGAGKSTLAHALERRLYTEGIATCLLDGDSLRAGLNRDLGFSDADRTENIRRAAEVARIALDTGLVVIAAFITPLREQRRLACTIVGQDDFISVHAAASYEVCRQRDLKGLYAKVAAGEVKQFTGRDSLFELPEGNEIALSLDTGGESPEASIERLCAFVLPQVRLR